MAIKKKYVRTLWKSVIVTISSLWILMTRQLLFQNSTFWNGTPCVCMSHIQAYSLFFIVLGPAHEIQIFRFFHFLWPFCHNIQWYFKIFVSAHILLLKNRFSVYKPLVLKEGVRIQGENSKKILKLQLRIRPGGFWSQVQV